MTHTNDKAKVTGWVVAVVQSADGSKETYEFPNIVTTDGDIYYAQRGCEETPTNDFNTGIIDSESTPAAPVKGDDYGDFVSVVHNSRTVKSGYPKTNDGDADNSGRGVSVITWLFEYLTADFNATVTGIGISEATPTGTDPILMRATPTSFTKDGTQTLKLFINHTVTGV